MRRSLLILTVLLFMPAIGFSQTTWYVPDDFPTIQGAISDASVVNGDTVIVRAGIYVEIIDFLGKAITLKSEQGPGVTKIDGNYAGSVVTCQSGEGSDSVLDGFTITNGYNAGKGGGMFNSSSSPTVTNCTFTGNSANHGGGMENFSSSSPTVTHCTFSGNSANYGGGMSNDTYSNPTVTNCNFTENSSVFGGGMANYRSSPTVANCTFTGNSASSDGGGMVNVDFLVGSNPTVTNCTFSGNSASSGGGMYNDFFDVGNHPTVTNCILWNDSPDEIYNKIGSSPTVTYSCVQDGYSGAGNIDADPLFVGGGDFHITSMSPCMEAGYDFAPAIPATDCDGENRIIDGDRDGTPTVDMGADEFCLPITWFVPGDYPTIQQAIDAATYWDTILVNPGTYVENIDFLGKAITLKSEQGPSVTIIDGNQAGSVVTCQSGEDADSVLDGFTITNGYAGNGGGMFNSSSNPTVTNCTFIENYAVNRAGGMYNYFSSSPTLTNCTFTDNYAAHGGGMLNDSSSPTVTHCTFNGNSVTVNGGGMFNYSSSNPTVTNCNFTGNSTTSFDSRAGGMYNFYSSPTVTNCTFIENSSAYGGGMFNDHCSPTVTNSTFTGNWANVSAGGMFNYISSSPTVTNCTFTGNSSFEYGGGMYNYSSSSPTVTHCTFTGNSAKYGGGMSNHSSSSPTVTNCILWNDSPDEIYIYSSSPTVTYSCVEGGYAGTGNIDADPLFLDPLNDDYHLTYASPCIDAGDNNAPSLPAMDFEGDPRIFQGNGKGVYLVGSPPQPAIVDMGADEYCMMKRQKVIPK